MININQLPPISELPSIDHRFKAFAGPGAGKTTWLINHIKRIIKTSKHLGVTRKIACITYTNVAAEQLVNKMDCNHLQIEVSTIHSFLYNNIIKPFAHLIEKDDDGNDLFNISEMQGHEEHIPHPDRIRRWLSSIEKANGKRTNFYGYLNVNETRQKLISYLSNLEFKFGSNGKIELYGKRYVEIAVPTVNNELWIYKKKYWSDGIMHHEDVLYFTYYIITKSPRVLEFVRNKYPYIFIDEFQDTTALQTIIVKMIADGNTTIGLIGDLAQSIYKFAGAVRSDFENLALDGMASYKLERNFRSTQSIITYLNNLRSDIEQSGYKDTLQGEPVTILVGTNRECYRWLLENLSPDIIAMAKEHKDVESIRAEVAIQGVDLVKLMFAQDSNSKRARFIQSLLLGYRWLSRKNNKLAVKTISLQLKAINSTASQIAIRNASIFLLEFLKAKTTQNLSLHDFYLQSNVHLQTLFQLTTHARFAAGAAQTFYRNCLVKEVVPFIKVDTQSDETIRTIHSSKGAEFDHVLVCMQSFADLERNILDAKVRLVGDADDARVYYVGFSRAKKNLFIAVPEFKDEYQERFENLGLKVFRIPQKGDHQSN